MKAQDLEYARIELRRALAVYSGKTKGQLEAFSNKPPAEKNRITCKPIHTVELEDGKGSKRKVKAENTAVYALETRNRRRPLPLINEEDFATSCWRRAVNQLAEHEQAWLRYCYGYDLTFGHQVAICEFIWAELKKTLPIGLRKKTLQRLVPLVWVAVQEVACMRSNDTYREYAGALLASRMGVSRSTWCESYKPYWQSLKIAMEELDVGALMNIYRIMKFDTEVDE